MSIDRHAVVAGAAGQTMDGRPSAAMAAADLVLQPRRARRVLPSCVATDVEADVAPRAIAAKPSLDRGHGAPPLLVGRRAHVERESRLAGDHVHGARPRLDAPDGAHDLRARAAMRSTAITHSAAAASASRRSPIGTVPAWPAIPVISIAKRLPPLIAVTTPTGRPSASSTGPCSMCSSA